MTFSKIISSLINVWVIIFPMLLVAQTTNSFKGNFKINQYNGTAEFSYQTIKNDTVFNGPFLMYSINPNQLLNKNDKYLKVSGYLENNKAVNDWSFKFGTFSASNKSALNNYSYEIELDGNLEKVDGNFISGKPNGTWKYFEEEIEHGKVKQNTFESNINFINGMPEKTIKIENKNSLLIGFFLKGGFAHDVWEVYDKNDPNFKEKWHFNEGLLNSITIHEDNSTTKIDLTDLNSTTKATTLSQNYFELIKWYAKIKVKNIPDFKFIKLVNENEKNYDKVIAVLDALNSKGFSLGFKAKANYYPLNNDELACLKSFKSKHKNVSKRVISLLENSKLQISKLTDDELEFYYAVIQKLNTSVLKPLNHIILASKKDILKYLPRDTFISTALEDNTPTTDIKVTLKEQTKTFKLKKIKAYQFDIKSLKGVDEIMSYASDCLDSIQSAIETKIETDLKQDKLIEIEEILLQKITKLNMVADSVQVNQIKYKSFVKNLVEISDKNLVEYSNLENTNKKINLASEMLNCLDASILLLFKTDQLKSQKEELNKLYTNDVWNPFTATVMHEDIKPRLLDAYNKIILPYILNGHGDGLSCKQINKISLNLDKSYKRMTELVNENTKKLERRIKKEKDPKTIMQLFNIFTQ